ncbi:hypothetical protein J4220_01295 [Candidatus Micrarchaeota archaeon]|nr:hypothetical protein [Candidatus Micrarchaeota archaeon]
MMKGWSSESTTNRLLMIIALFAGILAFTTVFVLESMSRASSAPQTSLSGYFVAVTPSDSLAARPSRTQPDLFTELDPSVAVKRGQSVTFGVKTQNIGAIASNPSVTKITILGGSDLVFDVPSLAPGAFAATEFLVKCDRTGSKLIRSFADFGKQISESDETNNIDAEVVECQ